MANATPVTVDGTLNDWTAGDRIDRGLGAGYAIYARSDGADSIDSIEIGRAHV